MTRLNCRIALCICLFVPIDARAQVSGYASGMYGFHSNPMYNYGELSDQVKQGYLELNYVSERETSAFKLGYVGGLVLFNRFDARNYLEHGIAVRYGKRYERNERVLPSGEESSEEEGGGDSDSLDSYLDVGVKVSVRHNKAVYNEYDTYGLELIGSYRAPAGGRVHTRPTNVFGYRAYVNVPELSNVMDMVGFELGLKTGGGIEIGAFVSGGLKFFTQSGLDTTALEVLSSSKGKGKGNSGQGGGQGQGSKKKSVLVAEGSNTVYQLVGGAFLRAQIGTAAVSCEALYRYNPTSSTRYLAQFANTSFLTEDIYNDHFSFEGSEVRGTAALPLLFGLQASFALDLEAKSFAAPALSLAGAQTNSHRKDLRTSLEVGLSRYFELSSSVGLDISMHGQALRNQSNDEYNDFSASGISVSVGVSF